MYIKIIDSQGEEIGCIKKKYVIPLKLRHQISRVIAYTNDPNMVLLQQRSLSDSSCPGQWDTSSSGHVDAHESHQEAAIRELKEELGITIEGSVFSYVGSFDTSVEVDKGRLERETHIYALKLEAKNKHFKINTKEINQIKWIDMRQLNKVDTITKGARESLSIFKEWLSSYTEKTK